VLLTWEPAGLRLDSFLKTKSSHLVGCEPLEQVKLS